MKLLIHSPQKNGVTRVTGVTKTCKLLNIKGLARVTRRNAQRYTTCYAVESCNNTCPAISLLVEGALVVNRCIRYPQRGQGAVDGR